MADLQRVKQGQSITAAGYNALVATVIANSPRPLQGQPFTHFAQGVIVWAHNIGGSNLAARDTAVVTGQAISANPETHRGFVIEIEQSEAGDNLTALAVCLEKIDDDNSGRVLISGVTWANTDGAAGGFATLEAGNKILTVGNVGPVGVLARESGNLALVHIGGAGRLAQETAQWVFWNETPPGLD